MKAGVRLYTTCRFSDTLCALQVQEASAQCRQVARSVPEPAQQRAPAMEAGSGSAYAPAVRRAEGEPSVAATAPSAEEQPSEAAKDSQPQRTPGASAGASLRGQGANAKDIEVGGADCRSETVPEKAASKVYSKAGNASLIAVDANTQESVTAEIQEPLHSTAAPAAEPAPPQQPTMPRTSSTVDSFL